MLRKIFYNGPNIDKPVVWCTVLGTATGPVVIREKLYDSRHRIGYIFLSSFGGTICGTIVGLFAPFVAFAAAGSVMALIIADLEHNAKLKEERKKWK